MLDDERFERMRSDEDDQNFSGRVIRRVRARILDGRVEIHWQFHAEFVHRGFFLTGNYRRSQGSWEPLAFEPHQDSGSWIECFDYGESRSYVFTVKKTYRFFFGLLAGDGIELVCDQISFSVRRGKQIKEDVELLRDGRQLFTEAIQCITLQEEIRAMRRVDPQPKIAPLGEIEPSAKLQARFQRRSTLADFVESKRNEILEHSSWSDERKRVELDQLEQLAE